MGNIFFPPAGGGVSTAEANFRIIAIVAGVVLFILGLVTIFVARSRRRTGGIVMGVIFMILGVGVVVAGILLTQPRSAVADCDPTVYISRATAITGATGGFSCPAGTVQSAPGSSVCCCPTTQKESRRLADPTKNPTCPLVKEFCNAFCCLNPPCGGCTGATGGNLDGFVQTC